MKQHHQFQHHTPPTHPILFMITLGRPMAVMLHQNPVARILKDYCRRRTVTSSSSSLLVHNKFTSVATAVATMEEATGGVTRGLIFFAWQSGVKNGRAKEFVFYFCNFLWGDVGGVAF